MELTNNIKLAIIAALEREVRPLVKDWPVAIREHDGRKFKIFETNHVVLICGGIGAEAARRATEAAIAFYQPSLILSVGFAGALDSTLLVGHVFVPDCVINARDGSRVETNLGKRKLLTVAGVAGVSQKTKFASAYGAQAIDMEAAAVAGGALTHGIRFMAAKSISDEVDFELPSMERFIAHDGTFHIARFSVFIAFRPWLWNRLFVLEKNSRIAAKSLCEWLGRYIREPEKLDNLCLGPHPTEIVSAT